MGSVRFAGRRSTALLLCVLSWACVAPPRADVEPVAAIASAVGIDEPVRLRFVDADGGPLDELDSAGSHLTRVEAVRRALAHDPRLQAALARVRVAAAEADAARTLPNPVLDVVLRGGDSSVIEAGFGADFIRALQRPSLARAADDALRARAAEALECALDVQAQIEQDYVIAQASAARVPLFEERLALLERWVATARARLDVGEGTRGDWVTLDAQRVELQVEIDAARLVERTQRLALARRIGEPSSPALWQLDPWVAPAAAVGDESAWIDAALASRAEIQAIRWRLSALGAELDSLRLQPWSGAQLGIDAEREDAWNLGPALSTPLPLFDDGSSARERQRALELEARHGLSLARRAIVEEVRRAFGELSASAQHHERVERHWIPLQLERRRLAEDAYRAGLTDVTPLLLAEQDLRLARTRAIEIGREAALARVRLTRAVGGPAIAARMESPTSKPGSTDGAKAP